MNKATKWYARLLYAVIAVALVMGLTLVPTLVPVASPIVEASVSGVTVAVSVPAPSSASNYTINFTTTKKLLMNVDTITVEFPSSTTTNTSLANITAAKTKVNGTVASAVSTGGLRASVTVGANVSAGPVHLIFGISSAAAQEVINNPSPGGQLHAEGIYQPGADGGNFIELHY